MARCLRTIVPVVLILLSGSAFAQAMYKYQGENGEWIFTDRAPPEEQPAEEAPATTTSRLLEAKRRALGHHDAGRGCWSHLRQDRQQLPCAWMRGEDTVVFPAIHSAVDGMQDPVALSWPGEVKKGSAQKPLPCVTEC